MKNMMLSLLKLQTLEFGDSHDKQSTATITELRGVIPTQILGHYDRLRARNKKGVAAVRNQVCTGCHMRVPLAVIMTLKHGADVRLCDSCGRYLFLMEEPETIAPPVVPKKTRKRRADAVAV
jgi:predicted  nucleic acid-binding Zn-ribbon protein